MIKMIEKHKKLLFAVLGVFLMTSGIFSLIAYIPASPGLHGGNLTNLSATPDLSNVSESAEASIGVNYWYASSLHDSAPETVCMQVVSNSTYSKLNMSDTSKTWKYGSSLGSKSMDNISIPSRQIFTKNSTELGQFGLADIAFMTQYAEKFNDTTEDSYFCYMVGIIYANITLHYPNGTSEYTYCDNAWYKNSNSTSHAFILTPLWNLSDPISYTGKPINSIDAYASAILNITLLMPPAPAGWQYSWTTGGSNENGYTTWSPFEIGCTTLTTLPQQEAAAYNMGYHIVSSSSTFLIPKYESSYNITWSSYYPTNPEYNGESQSGTSGTFIGSLTDDKITVNPDGIPNLCGVTSVNLSFFLSSQIQVSQTSTTESLSSSYTYSQVSGTTNEASGSFSFSGSIPSNAVFLQYETGINSLSTDDTNIIFTPTISITNPYYSFSQNDLVASLSGASIGSSNTSNTESPSFSGGSASYTTSTSPSWTVSLKAYGNTPPSVTAPTLSSQNSGSEMSATFTISQPVFSGELQDATITWGDGTTSTYDNLAPGTYTYYHSYSGTYQGTFSQTYSPYVTITNVPNPDSNSLSGLTTTGSPTSYTIGMVDNPTTPDSILKVGQSIYMNITTTNLALSGATVSLNGLAPASATLIKHTGSTYDFKYSSSLFGVSGVTITWSIDPAGITDIFSTQYATPIEPTTNSSYVTALFSNTATHSYPISLSGVPTGTGFYQQLITISNPSSYGINTAGSNIQFTSGNNTLLYAWIQSINSTCRLAIFLDNRRLQREWIHNVVPF